MPDPNGLTQAEQTAFAQALEMMDQTEKIGLLRVHLSVGDDELPAAAIVINVDLSDEYTGIIPIALLMTDDLMDRISPPDGGEEVHDGGYVRRSAAELLDEAIGAGLLDEQTLAGLAGLPHVESAVVMGSQVRLYTEEV